MNIFLFELKAHRKSTVIWTFVLSGIALMYLSIYPSFADVADKLIKDNPAYLNVITKMFGVGPDVFTQIITFYSLTFIYISLCAAIQAMYLGTSIISKEGRDKTSDFLLSKPVSRQKILVSKISAGFILILITNIFYQVFSLIIAATFNPGFDTKRFILISLSMLFLQVIFLTIGICIGIFTRRIKSVISVTLITVFSFFIANLLSNVIDDRIIRYLTPFKYFDAKYIIANSSYDIQYIIIFVVFVITAIGFSAFKYIKKDIPSL